MKPKTLLHKLYILLITTVCVLSTQAQATSPPIQACVGGKSVFAVSGEPGASFRFEVTGGEIVDSTRLDSIVVQWGMEQGLFRIATQEQVSTAVLEWMKKELGVSHIEIDPECQGPWVYVDVDLRGRPFRFDQTDMTIGTGEVINFPMINSVLYKTVRWYKDGLPDPTVTTNGITVPGNYRIWVEDMHGCIHTDTVTVSLRP